MKNKTLAVIAGLSIIIMLSGIETCAKNDSRERTASSGNRSTVRITSGQRTSVRSSANEFRGAAKVTVRRGSSAGSGLRGGVNRYSRNFYWGYNRGYYRGGSYWPFWPIGSYITYLPDDYTTVYVDGDPYYYCNGSYFTPYSNGYVAVPAPDLNNASVPETMVQDSSDTVLQPSVKQLKSVSTGRITINIPDSKGGFTPVVLVKYKGGYTGPQGEYYPGHPTVDQLKVLYGN